jgi:hypothetical protein
MFTILKILQISERKMQPSINPMLSETNRFNKPVEEILRYRSQILIFKF